MESRPNNLVGDRIGRLLGRGIVALALLLGCCGPLQAAPAQPVPQLQPPTAPRVVEMGIYVTNIYDLNLAASTYKISFWLWFKSNDEKYEPEKAIDIVGGKDIKVEATATQRLADGTYYRSAKYSATINQMWDVRFYPFDREELKIVIESTIEEVSSLIFVADEKNSGVDPHIVLPGWVFSGGILFFAILSRFLPAAGLIHNIR